LAAALKQKQGERVYCVEASVVRRCGSGVGDDGQCDDGGFKLDTASVVADAAVELKEVRE
jgi:hypothetical protein